MTHPFIQYNIKNLYRTKTHHDMELFHSRLHNEKSSFKRLTEHERILYTYTHSLKEYIQIFQQMHVKVILLKMIFFISFSISLWWLNTHYMKFTIC